ncbi:pyrroline-5-carboxylate reductase [Leptospira yasudae]|uniref:Pyrroline-5-carboxylate reductase n=1 Tax=Leptospira yasudae TaxID=2202201 RepID=A0ABX9LY45_9LEPT|nr:pyrroline-5-carboxylate reductase [Leptospira yasudae]RHX77755.1 pyrroline-5-carboxylate reductase [Leptospira yasudae]RHX93728.1 pyrroline-5-carboxylate reductase [Leptospira yasudae]TGK25552.1 pyrroline-5-carboxylate reductase [Leptospira yasudae]TGM02651.1 pyrroline-5-carboxylate reductase [Leptospira yasudae]
MKHTIGIAGCGNMGGAIYLSLKERYPKQVLGYDPYMTSNQKIELVSSWEEFSAKSDVIIVCVKPGKVAELLGQIKTSKKIISVAAGIGTETLRKNLPNGSQVVRVMPNLPLLVSEGAIGYFGDRDLYETVTEIFQSLGHSVELGSESLLDAVTGLSGSGPAFVFKFIQALAEGGVLSGLGYQEALDLSIQTVIGSAELLRKERKKDPSTHPEVWKNKVTSPGGTTIAGLAELEKNGFTDSILQAVKAATKRSQELGG